MASDFPFKVRFTAIDKMSSAIDKVRSKFPALTKDVTRAANAFTMLQAKTEGMRNRLTSVGNSIKGVGQTLTASITLPVVAGLGLSIKAFADYETALVGVGKTTGLGGAELEAFGEKISSLSRKIPVSSEELLGLGQTAAQLGVSGSDNILKFSETLAKLSRASDVTGDEGAAQLARFIQVTGGSIGEVDKFASALVQLGNTSAATEAEILGFAARMGGATAIFNVTGSQALGLSTALKSVGIEADAGSSSVQRTLGAMNEAILGGGKEMMALSKITGIATGDLKKRFKTDAMGVLRDFAQGLNNVEKKGGDVSAAMKIFGLTGVRDIQVIGTLSKNVELLDEKLKTSEEAFKANTALEQEFSTASKTLANNFILLKNNLTAVAVKIGKVLAPIVSVIIAKLSAFSQWLLELNPTVLKWGLILAGVAAFVGPLVLALGVLITMIPALITGFNLFIAGMAALKIMFIPLALVMLKFVAIAALVATAAVMIYKNWEPIKTFFYDLFTNPLQQIKELISWAGKLTGISSLLGLGDDIDEKLKAQGFNIEGPKLGNEVGASKQVKSSSDEKAARDSKARVGIEFSNLPMGAKTKVEGNVVDTMSFKTGFLNGAL